MNQNTISKTGINPLLATILAIVCRTGPVYNGQTSKWAVLMLVEIVGYLLCVVPGVFIWILVIIDSYQTAERLKSGESIPENEYSLPLLYSIVRIIDATATCSRDQSGVSKADGD
jgi:hypothetical protein